jgi:hypothetical protein
MSCLFFKKKEKATDSNSNLKYQAKNYKASIFIHEQKEWLIRAGGNTLPRHYLIVQKINLLMFIGIRECCSMLAIWS